VPNRSADIFSDLLHMLRGYPVHIRNDEHRTELLRDCRYFHLKGLEQKLIRHHIEYNLSRGRSEITIRLDDIRPSGISFVADSSPPSTTNTTSGMTASASTTTQGYVHYARPFVDDAPAELIVEIGAECTRLHLSTMRAEFFGTGRARITRLFEVVANKMGLRTTQPLGLMMSAGGATAVPASPGNSGVSEEAVKVRVGVETCVVLDGTVVRAVEEKRRLLAEEDGREWVIRTGQWRVRVQANEKGGVEVVLMAVKLDALSGENGRNELRSFLEG
jgi:hypothetical protein